MNKLEELSDKYKRIGAKGAVYLGKWKGYDVYGGDWPNGAKIGPPPIVLVKGDKEIFPEFKEVFEILDCLKKEK